MWNRKLIALGLAGMIGAAAMPAQADTIRLGNENFGIQLRLNDHDHRRDVRHAPRQNVARLGPRQIRRILRRQGYHDITTPRYRPRADVYVVTAENRRNRDVRIRVDADTGRVLNVARLDPPRRRGQDAGHNRGRHEGHDYRR